MGGASVPFVTGGASVTLPMGVEVVMGVDVPGDAVGTPGVAKSQETSAE